MKLLIVEDEPSYVEALEVALLREGFETAAAQDGRAALESFDTEPPDLVLLDLMLPELSGLDVLRTIRESSQVPVIVVSAKDAEADVVSALELGADDYLTKPFSIRELVARVRANLRRSNGGGTAGANEVIVIGATALDRGRYQLRVGEQTFDLPRKEFEVIEMLMLEQGRVVTRERLLDEIWGITWTDSKTLDQHIRRLRRKLEHEDGSPTIASIRGVGYRLET